MNVSGISPERQLILDYLSSFGLDGTEISSTDYTEEGFWLIRHQKTFHPWPEGFAYSWFDAAVRVAAAADWRRARVRPPV